MVVNVQFRGNEPSFRANLLLCEPPSRGLLYVAEIVVDLYRETDSFEVPADIGVSVRTLPPRKRWS